MHKIITIITAGLLATTSSLSAFSVSRTFSGGDNNFGYSVYLNANDAFYNSGSIRYKLYGRAQANAKVFNITREIADGYSTFYAYTNTNIRGTFALEFYNSTIWSYDRTIYANHTLSYAPFKKEVKFATPTFWVGPVPVTCEAGASASLAAVANAKNSPSSVTVAIYPRAELAAVANAGAGIPGASAGVEGKLTIVKSELKAEATVTVSQRKVAYGVNWVNTTLSGTYGLYAKLAEWKYTYTLGSWSGYSKTTPLLSGTQYY